VSCAGSPAIPVWFATRFAVLLPISSDFLSKQAIYAQNQEGLAKPGTNWIVMSVGGGAMARKRPLAGGSVMLESGTIQPDPDAERTLLIRRHLRSGQRIRFAGNVVVLGDVNPGAEIEATGDIVVMGTLRGLAHAGSGGDTNRIITAFRVAATQLRIAHHVARAPEGDEPPPVPEVALVEDGQVLIDSYLKRFGLR
jgi:septum site-determining protein MinC